MKRCRTHLVQVCLIFLAVVPAYCQRGTFGLDVGNTSDKFGSLSSASGLVVGVDGQLTILNNNPKNGRPAILAGGEVRIPTDTQNHSKEYAVFGGLRFPIRNFSIGFDAQVRKIYLPPANVDNQVFVRDKLEFLEIPLVVKYNFGPAKRAFIEAKGAPEFSPHFREAGALLQLPNPNWDHGYFIRGTVGYLFGKYWYAKATYETRYFKFEQNQNNPNGFYNWHSNLISGGVGVAF